jgi:glycosyltransferase involved in cell wall biosynthesis
VADPNPYRRQIERWIYWFAAMNFCVSRDVAKSYARSGFTFADDSRDIGAAGFWHNKLYVIPNAIDPTIYQRAEPTDLSHCGFGPKRPVLLFIGRLHRQKGLDWLLSCMPELLVRLSDHELVLVGDGPERDRLMRQGVELNVADHVHFMGWRADIPQLLKRASLLVLPSRYEGMPNVLLEAMAAGVPTVATRAEGTEEILGSLAEKYLVEFGNSRELIERIVELATPSETRTELVQRAKDRVEREFSVQFMAEHYKRFWRLATSAGREACP